MFDEFHEDLIFDDVVFPGIVNNKRRLALKDIADVLLLMKIAVFYGFYYGVDQFYSFLGGVFVFTDFQNVIKDLLSSSWIVLKRVFVQKRLLQSRRLV